MNINSIRTVYDFFLLKNILLTSGDPSAKIAAYKRCLELWYIYENDIFLQVVHTLAKSSNRVDIELAFHFFKKFGTFSVGSLLVQNEHLPVNIMEKFLEYDRYLPLLAKNPSLPSNIIDKLVRTERTDVLEGLLENEKFNINLFTKYIDYFAKVTNKNFSEKVLTFIRKNNVPALELLWRVKSENR